MGRNIDKNINENLSCKYNQNLLHYAKQSAKDALETAPKKTIQKGAESTGDLISNKIPIKLQEPQKLHHRIIRKKMKKKYIEKDLYLRHKVIDDQRLKEENYWWSKIIIIM